jgi:hypothetical protein
MFEAKLFPCDVDTRSVQPRMYLRPGMGSGQLFSALEDWVVKGAATAGINLSSADNNVSRPICLHPQQAEYNGTDAITSASSYACR